MAHFSNSLYGRTVRKLSIFFTYKLVCWFKYMYLIGLNCDFVFTVLVWLHDTRFQRIDLVFCWWVRKVKVTAVISVLLSFIILNHCPSMCLIFLLCMQLV